MNLVTSRDYPQVYEDLGIDTGNLGCIMADTEPIIINDVIPEESFYYSDEHQYVSGNVSENVPHVTLLYGLMRSGNELKKHVDAVLDGMEFVSLEIEGVSFFYGSDSDYITIIALIKVTDELREANARLRLLPHIDTFGEYKPHVTLAYVKASSDWNKYVNDLNAKYQGQVINVTGINYGD